MARPAKQQSKIASRTLAGLVRSTSAMFSQARPLNFGRFGRVEVTVRHSFPRANRTPWPT